MDAEPDRTIRSPAMEFKAPSVRFAKALVDFSAFAVEPATGEEKPEYIVKELTIVDIRTGYHMHWIFKPPEGSDPGTGSRRSALHNRWLSDSYHGLDFDVGLTDYGSLPDALKLYCGDANLVFAPNRAKAKVLESLFAPVKRAVFDLEALGCPPPPSFNFFSRSVAAYDGISVPTKNHDTDDRPPERAEEISTAPSCTYHNICARFACTQSRALHMGLWCALNPSALDMNDAANREKTFYGWDLSAPSARDLAKAGFVRFGGDGGAKCVYCGFSPGRWTEGDDPDEMHQKNVPCCKLLRYRDHWSRRRGRAGTSDKTIKKCAHRPDSARRPARKRRAFGSYGRCGRGRDVTLRDLNITCFA